MSRAATKSESPRSRRPLRDFAKAAEYTGLEERYLRRLVAEKRIPHIKMSPGRTGRVYFDPDELDGWIVSRAIPVDA